MAWLIQSDSPGPVLVQDMGLTFTYKQIKNVDLIGRHNAEQSRDLRYLLDKKFLVEIRKDASEETLDPKTVKQLKDTIQQAQEVVQTQSNKINSLEEQNNALKQQNNELHSKMDIVLNEVKAFSERFPLEIRTISEAIRNAESERVSIAKERKALPKSGESDAEIKLHDKILALKEKKLEKNVKDLGKTVSESASDYKDTLDALDKLNL